MVVREGESFIPTYVYDALKKRFDNMWVSVCVKVF